VEVVERKGSEVVPAVVEWTASALEEADARALGGETGIAWC
jgi:hypothetical protein